MASYFEVVWASVPSLECYCYVSPSLAPATPSQVVGMCGSVAGPLVLSLRLTAHLRKVTFLWNTRTLYVSSRMLRSFGASPLAFRTKLVSVRVAYELLLELFALPVFHLTWGAVVTSRQQHVLSAPRSGHSHVTVLGSRAVADATQRRAVRLGRRPAGWHVRRS